MRPTRILLWGFDLLCQSSLIGALIAIILLLIS